jgi:hypothetical protein
MLPAAPVMVTVTGFFMNRSAQKLGILAEIRPQASLT